jgi:hypothetical protein
MRQLMRKLAIVGIVMFVVLPASWSEEFNYASYTQTTLQDIIAEEQNHSHDQAEAKKDADCIQLEYSKYRVSCFYSNIRRPISEKKKNVIKLWMETLQIDPKLASLYQQEIMVTEGSRDHWIPIQEQLFSFINQELARNDTIELFIILICKVESEFVFIATEFEKPISPAKNSIQATAFTLAAP